MNPKTDPIAYPRVLVIDNYDSFTYNLVQLIDQVIGSRPDIVRNDVVKLSKLPKYSHIVLSPGPGLPKTAGKLTDVVANVMPGQRLLGICLGLQAIAEVNGATLENLERVFHGVQSGVNCEKHLLFKNIPKRILVGRYHSWVVNRKSIPKKLNVICEDDDGQVMGLAHKTKPVYGLQFHPESIMTENGKTILENFLMS